MQNEPRNTNHDPRNTSHEPRATSDETMQNKPNYKKGKMNATSLLLTTNDQRLTTREAQNKPNQTQSNPIFSLSVTELDYFPKSPKISFQFRVQVLYQTIQHFWRHIHQFRLRSVGPGHVFQYCLGNLLVRCDLAHRSRRRT